MAKKKPEKFTAIWKKIIGALLVVLCIGSAGMWIFLTGSVKKIITQEKNTQFNREVDLVLDTLQAQKKLYEQAVEGSLLDFSSESGSNVNSFRGGMSFTMGSGMGSGSNSVNEQLKTQYQDEIIQILRERYYREDTTIYPVIMDFLGNVVLHPDLKRGSSAINREEFIRRALKEQNGSFDFTWQGEKRFIVFRTFPEWAWLVGVIITHEEKYQAVGEFRSILILFITIFFLSVLGIVFLILNHVLKPLKLLDVKLKEISTGEADLTQQVEVKTSDEVGSLGLSFNSFIEMLRVIMAKIKSSSSENLHIKDDLAANTEETASALTEIAANVESIVKTHVTRLNDNVIESTTAMEEMNANVTSMDEQMVDQASRVEETTAAVTEMIASMDNVAQVSELKKAVTRQLIDTAAVGGKKLDSTVQIVADTTERIGLIREMVSTINGIAAQTNLLSMNAAIEAAHAGDSGRGFAVVAEEIRNLAESSSKNAKQIGNDIKTVISLIEQAGTSSRETMESFKEINEEVKEVSNVLDEVARATNEVALGGKEILEAMTGVNDITNHIKTASSEIKSGINNMTDSMTDIKDISRTVSQGLNEVSRGTQEITQAMLGVSDLTAHLGDSTNTMNNEIYRFHTGEEEADDDEDEGAFDETEPLDEQLT